MMLDLGDATTSLIVLNGFSCVAAAFLCLRAAPRGLHVILRYVRSLSLPVHFREQLSDMISLLEMEEDVLKARLNKLTSKASPSSRYTPLFSF